MNKERPFSDWMREQRKEFHKSFNPDARIAARVKDKLCDYGIIDHDSVVIDDQIPRYVEDEIWKDGEARILHPFGRFVREIVRQKGDVRLVNILSKREKRIIRDYRTPKGRTASLGELPELGRKIKGLYLGSQSTELPPKGEAAFWHYLATRRPEELGKKYMGNPERYKQKTKYLRACSRRIVSDVYNCVPRTKYWWLVWDALDCCWSFALPSEKLMGQKQWLKGLNLVPFEYSFLTSNVLELPDEYVRLKAELIKEAGEKPLPGLVDDVWTMGNVLHQMEIALLNAVRAKDDQITERLTTGYTFWIGWHLKEKHREVCLYYLKRTRIALKKLGKIKDGYQFEELEYLDLKTRIQGDLLFACVFHYHVRGGERFLKIRRGVGASKKYPIKEALEGVKPWLYLWTHFGIRNWLDKAVLLLNAMGRKEIYSTRSYVRSFGVDLPELDQGRIVGVKYRGSRVLAEELRRLKKKGAEQGTQLWPLDLVQQIRRKSRKRK